VQQKFWVNGSNGKVLYNLEKGKVFKLNKTEAAKFKQFCYKKEDLRQFLRQNSEMQLKHVNLELTAKCNLRCVHCYGGREFGKGEKEISTRQWKKIIREIAAFNPKFLLFTGGEALLRKDFSELLFFAHCLGLNTSLFSNLTVLSEEHAKALQKTKTIVQFSAYGHNAKMHDFITGVEGSFEKQQASLKRLNDLGVPLRGQIIVMKQNLPFQKQIKSFFKKQDIPTQFSIARPSSKQPISGIPGCATCSFPKNYLEANQSPVSISLDFFAMKHFYNNCWIQRCAVTAEGKVLACVFARDKVLGDLTKQSFKQAFKSVKENAAEHKCNNILGCSGCSLRFTCLDCRPWAFSLTGNRKQKNPYCKEVG